MKRFILVVAGITLASTSALAAAGVSFPDGYRSWNHVKSLVIEPGHPLADPFGGLHHVYVNDAGVPALQKAAETKASTAYPDGTVFVFDLHEAAKGEHTVGEGPRKFVGVMRKDAKGNASTGGWGFEVFKGDGRERAVTDGGAGCWGCHQGQPGGVFSTWTP